MEANIIQLEKGGEKLQLGGQSFYSRLRKKNKTYWRCAVKACPATAVTINKGQGHVEVVKEAAHSHTVQLTEEDDDEDYEHEDSTKGEDEEDDAQDEEEEHGNDDMSVDEQEDLVLWAEWREESSDDEESDGEESDDEDSGDEDLDEDDQFGYAYEVKIAHENAYTKQIRFLREPEHNIRAAALENANKGLICFLNEICYNLLRGYFPMSKYEKSLLENYKDDTRFLAHENIGWREKKEFLSEHAEDPFLSVLLNDLADRHYLCR